jgi:drug/metabolite transporter (DMT)-like permease
MHYSGGKLSQRRVLASFFSLGIFGIANYGVYRNQDTSPVLWVLAGLVAGLLGLTTWQQQKTEAVQQNNQPTE